VAPDRVVQRFTYHHPVFTTAGVRAQERHSEISGRYHTHYCGAYWGNGFHEDGVASAYRAALAIGGPA
jgi:predicted NAD/FAD-binding protein